MTKRRMMIAKKKKEELLLVESAMASATEGRVEGRGIFLVSGLTPRGDVGFPLLLLLFAGGGRRACVGRGPFAPKEGGVSTFKKKGECT